MCLPYRFAGNHSRKSNVVEDFLKAAYSIDSSHLNKVAVLLVDEFGLYEEQSQIIHPVSKSSVENLPAGKNKFNFFDQGNLNNAITEENTRPRLNANHNSAKNLTNHLLSSFGNIKNKTRLKGQSKIDIDIFDNVLLVSPLLKQSFPITYKSLFVKHKRSMDVSYVAYLMDAFYLAINVVSKALHNNYTKPPIDAR